MYITREAAIKEAGIEAVEAVEKENVQPTNSVTDNGQAYFNARVSFTDADGDSCELEMIVEVPQEEYDAAEELDQIDWDTYIAQAEFRII